ncbi:peptidylprolyl isomerase [Coleofasciculus sp. FACHB-64]|uniref:peptidylprolyl isomerase n=1 Tax=Cyanophyceae TaxID=3028117 RepID=UPI00168467A5|nr:MULTISPECIES: peptidylprolyl isomerase [unclassified Coleofasciculus]MBD1840416.1 peptidylprolyl isomerase [Coleofasciculus sp. FACHB-501]MBD2048402.1 peptidylprolyl isomerase [Coleofasciculus sp. FACHB-64]
MESVHFLLVNDQSISLEQALKYLRSSGKLSSFIGEILRQYVVDEELKNLKLDISLAAIEQAVIDFRLQRNLADPKSFQEWLARNRIDYETFHNQVKSGFQLTKLKAQIAEPKLQEYFIERKLFLDRVVLSRLVVAQQELAEELYSQLEEGASFEQLAQEYSLTDDRIVNGMMGPVSRGTLPDQIRAAIDTASPGRLLEPLKLENRWALFRVEQFLPASLEDSQLKEALQNELFEQWLAQKIQTLTVKLQIS